VATADQPILNVLFHGAFTFVEDPNRGQIRALIPQLDHHVYRAGSWLGETDLRPGTYELKGVHRGDASIDLSRNLSVDFDGSSEPRRPYATMVLPKPERITPLLTITVPTSAFDHPESLTVKGDLQRMSGLQVFTYGIADDAALRLEASDCEEGHYWEPAATGNHVNLHVISAEDRPGECHQHTDFEQCAALLGVHLKLTGRHEAAEDEELPTGVTRDETEPLKFRTGRMARLGRQITQQGDPVDAWRQDRALCGNADICTQMTGNPLTDLILALILGH
jgi:hypothetical protein